METNEQMNVEQNVEVKEEPKEPATAKEPKTRTYTDAEVDEIINKRFAKWQKEQDRKVEEAKRLEQMNAEEKAKYELGELQKELDVKVYLIQINSLHDEIKNSNLQIETLSKEIKYLKQI